MNETIKPTGSADPRFLSTFDPQHPNFAIDVVDAIIALALQCGASDVHVQPRIDHFDVLFRIDGVLSLDQHLPAGGPSDPVTRLMVLANLPTYRSTQPMEGRIRWRVDDGDNNAVESIALRLGIYPTVHGPRAVIRLLRTDDEFDALDSLGFTPDVTQSLDELCRQTDGAVLLSGPAGSGKTTTMYAMLRRIAAMRPRRSVMTIEDPIESIIPAISQSELDVAGGMTLASALRSAVRQDAEVLLVSEIRDPETAEAAVQASLTGHLVFSSFHATDVAASMRRLVQLGVPHYVIRSGVRAIVTQRLLRRRCPEHVGSGQHTDKDCPNCAGTGYRGRVAIASCVKFDGSDPVGEAMADCLAAGGTAQAMQSAAAQVGQNIQAGYATLADQAWELVAQEQTDATEVYRVLGATSQPFPSTRMTRNKDDDFK
jgi:general secretion pathway protein E